MKAMDACAIAFRDQFGLGGEPVLHLVTGKRTLVYVGEVCPPGHFVRRRHKINSVRAQVVHLGGLWCANRLGVLIGEISLVFHKCKMAGAGSALLTSQNRRVRGTLFNGLAVQVNKHRGFRVANLVNFAGGYLHFATR